MKDTAQRNITKPLDRNGKIYVAGHKGLVGSALVRKLEEEGFTQILTRTHGELDLTRQADVEEFFRQERPDYAILAAAKVGGIYANDTYPADFIMKNLQIECNVIDAAYKNQVKKLLFLEAPAFIRGTARSRSKRSICFPAIWKRRMKPMPLRKSQGLRCALTTIVSTERIISV